LNFLDYPYLKILIYKMDIQFIRYIKCKLDWNPYPLNGF